MTDKIREALDFYRCEAEALARYMAERKEDKSEAILASVTVLSLDGGRRAREALLDMGRRAHEALLDMVIKP